MITFGQLLLAVSIPSVIAIIGILMNQSAVSTLRAECAKDFSDIRDHFIRSFPFNDIRANGLTPRREARRMH